MFGKIKRLCFGFSYLLLIGILAGCGMRSDSSSDEGAVDDGFILVDVEGTTAWMGKPENAVRFTYDFWISPVEVTNGLFDSLMKGGVSDFLQSRKPKTNVNYWEIALFCNTLSKSRGLDSVYRYTSVASNESGSISALQGFDIDYSKNGYRLPTEAEWEFVAHQNQKQEYAWGNDTSKADSFAWYSKNSKGVLHDVGGLNPTTYQIYDLQGNAKELVDGWLGDYDSLAIENPVGAADPDNGDSRIVKGGSYLDYVGSLKTSFRKDVYQVTSSSRSITIGFRLARGRILKPSWFGANGDSSKRTSISMISSQNQIRRFFGSSKVKIAVVDNTISSLVWFDFSEQNATPHEIRDTLPIWNPTISPDGNWVAYSSRIEGQIGDSKMVVRKLDKTGSSRIVSDLKSAAIPRWWVDPVTLDTFLVFVSSARNNNDSLVWKDEKTYRQQFSNGMLRGEVEEIANGHGAFHAGVDSSGRYLVTGNNRMLMLDRKEDRVQQLFLSPQNGKGKDGSTQVCNVSISGASTPRLLFLDFGSPQVSSVVGRSYGIHEILFVSNMKGEILKTIPVPSPYIGWDHSEWSNNSDFAVATVWDQSESRSAVYGIHETDSELMPLLGYSEFSQPALWIGAPTDLSFNSDSLLRYNSVAPTAYTLSHSVKTKLFWETSSFAEGYIVGSSRNSLGISPTMLGNNVFNIAMLGHSTLESLRFIDHYIIPNTPHLRFLVIGVDVDLFTDVWPGVYQTYIESSAGYQYDKSHNFWVDYDKNILREQIHQIEIPQPNSVCPLDLFGFESCPSQGSWEIGDGCIVNAWQDVYDQRFNLVASTLDSLHIILGKLETMNIKVYLVQMPISPHYRLMDRWGCYNPISMEQGTTWSAQIQTVVNRHSNAKLLDFYQAGLHHFPDSLAYDCGHLNIYGANTITKILSDSIQAFK